MSESSTSTNYNKTKSTLTSLEDDDEFDDFPVEDWSVELANGDLNSEEPLWEVQWDDDDTEEHFASQLREELQKKNTS